MALAILDPARAMLQGFVRDISARAKIEFCKFALIVLALGLFMSAGLVALAQAVGYPIAAMVFAAILGLLVLVIHLIERSLYVRQSQRMARAQSRLDADIAVAASVARSALPLLPIVAFVAAFTLARRR